MNATQRSEFADGETDGGDFTRDFLEGGTSEQLAMDRQVSVSDYGLRNLKRWRDGMSSEALGAILSDENAASIVFFVIHPDRDGDHDAAQEFWDGVATTAMTAPPRQKITTAAYLGGFIAGALEALGKARQGD